MEVYLRSKNNAIRKDHAIRKDYVRKGIIWKHGIMK